MGPESQRCRKLLVLDINGLLLDTCFRAEKPGTDRKPDGLANNFHIYERPFCKEFGQFCLENFVVGVWSSAKMHNVEALARYAFGDGYDQLAFVWDQSKCSNTGLIHPENKHKPIFLKELSKLWNKEDEDLPWHRGDFGPWNTLLLDDTPYKALRNPAFTGIYPHTYEARHDGDCMLSPHGGIRRYLQDLVYAPDVTLFVQAHPFGQKMGDLELSMTANDTADLQFGKQRFAGNETQLQATQQQQERLRDESHFKHSVKQNLEAFSKDGYIQMHHGERAITWSRRPPAVQEQSRSALDRDAALENARGEQDARRVGQRSFPDYANENSGGYGAPAPSLENFRHGRQALGRHVEEDTKPSNFRERQRSELGAGMGTSSDRSFHQGYGYSHDGEHTQKRAPPIHGVYASSNAPDPAGQENEYYSFYNDTRRVNERRPGGKNLGSEPAARASTEQPYDSHAGSHYDNPARYGAANGHSAGSHYADPALSRQTVADGHLAGGRYGDLVSSHYGVSNGHAAGSHYDDSVLSRHTVSDGHLAGSHYVDPSLSRYPVSNGYSASGRDKSGGPEYKGTSRDWEASFQRFDSRPRPNLHPVEGGTRGTGWTEVLPGRRQDRFVSGSSYPVAHAPPVDKYASFFAEAYGSRLEDESRLRA